MKKLFSVLRSLVALLSSLCSCSEQGPTIAGFDVPAEIAAAGRHRALAACVQCTYVQGKNDVKKLCPGSVAPWDALVSCACSGPCSAPCSADWCSRLGDVQYTNASQACNDCIVSSCWPELAACSSAP